MIHFELAFIYGTGFGLNVFSGARVTDEYSVVPHLLVKVKEESEKPGLKPNIQKTKIMASGPITSWQIDGENNGNRDRLYFLGLQNHCRWQLQP